MYYLFLNLMIYKKTPEKLLIAIIRVMLQKGIVIHITSQLKRSCMFPHSLVLAYMKIGYGKTDGLGG